MEMTFPATMDSLHKMLQFIRVEARAAGFEGSLETQIELALEEALVNIIKHGYPGTSGDVEINCNRIGTVGLKVVLTDRGIAYDPLANATPLDLDPKTPLELKAIGGYGVHLIQSIMDQVEYSRRGDHNVLTLVKYHS